MRILLVHPGPPLSQHDVWRGWGKALSKLGHRVMPFRTDAFFLQLGVWPPTEEGIRAAQYQMSEAIRSCPADLVFFVGSSFLSTEVLEGASRAAILYTESPYEDYRQREFAPYVTANLVNDPVNIADYECSGRPALYVPHSYDPEIHYREDQPKDIDFIFIGTVSPSRVEFFGNMDLEGIDACIDGGGWFAQNGVGNEEAAGLYRRSRVGINLYRREGDTAYDGTTGWAMSPRELEMAACGLPFLRDPRGEGAEVLPFLPEFSGPADAAVKLRELLSDHARCAILGKESAEAVKERTFIRQAVRVVNFLEEIL